LRNPAFAIITAFILLVLASGTGRAQGLRNPLLPHGGTSEIEVRGSYQRQPEDVLLVFASYGPFLNRGRLQVGFSADYRQADGSDITTLGLFVNHYFPGRSPVLPFVGAFYGVSNGDGDSVTLWGVQGGAKYFVNRRVAATASLVYRDFDLEAAQDQLFLLFGLATYFR
jgi:hypothetical protein